jgi:DNA polymerase-3 subunit epsilon
VRHLELTRPLVLIDLETTGIDPARDKIVEIALLRIEPDGTELLRARRIDPERPIPPEATAVHGIRDEDVAGAPPFRRVARSLFELLAGADVGGYNVRRFDLPLLEREFRECGLEPALGERRVVDAMAIFHRKEPRDLSGAVRFYLGRGHEGAHGAEADLIATRDVLAAQLERYADLPRTVEGLDAWTRVRADAVDGEGKFVRQNDEIVFAFGRHAGRPLRQVAREAPDYLEWIVGSDFPEDAKSLVRRALAERT